MCVSDPISDVDKCELCRWRQLLEEELFFMDMLCCCDMFQLIRWSVYVCMCLCVHVCVRTHVIYPAILMWSFDHSMGEVANMDLSDLGKKCDFCNVSQINYTCLVGLFITFTTSEWLKHVLLVDTHPGSGLFIRSSTTHYWSDTRTAMCYYCSMGGNWF